MYYNVSSFKNAFVVGAALAECPEGLSLKTLGLVTGLSHKEARYVMDNLVKIGAVGVRWVSSRSRGGRRCAVFFAAYNRTAEENADALELAAPDVDEFDELEGDDERFDQFDQRDDSDDKFDRGSGAPVLVVEKEPDYLPKVGALLANNASESSNPSYSYFINKNTQEKKINKRARKARAFEKSVSESLAGVDLEDASLKELRAKLTEILWEPSLRSELLDRSCGAVALGLISANEILENARKAVKESLREKKTIWSCFTLPLKALFENFAGAFWDPTAPGGVPKPSKKRALIALELNGNDKEEESDAFRVFERNGRVFAAFA